MDKRRVQQLGNDLYNHVFQLLDGEIDSDSDEAGRVAGLVEQAFRDGLFHECSGCGAENEPILDRLCGDCHKNREQRREAYGLST